MGRTTRHLRALLLIAVLLASTLTTQGHHTGTSQRPGRATHVPTPQHASPRPAGRYVALPLRSIHPREARPARVLRSDNGPSAVASLLAHTPTRGPPLTEPVAA